MGAKFEVVPEKAPTTPEIGVEPSAGLMDEIGKGATSEDWIRVGRFIETPCDSREDGPGGKVTGETILAAFGGGALDGKPSCGTVGHGPGEGTIGVVVCPMLTKPNDAGTLAGDPGHPEGTNSPSCEPLDEG